MKRVSRKQHEEIKKGRTVSCDLFTLRVLPSPDGAFAFAPVVSKKVAKSAVMRNKLKRQLRESARAYEKMHPPRGVMVVAYAKKPVVTASFAHIADTFSTLLSSLR